MITGDVVIVAQDATDSQPGFIEVDDVRVDPDNLFGAGITDPEPTSTYSIIGSPVDLTNGDIMFDPAHPGVLLIPVTTNVDADFDGPFTIQIDDGHGSIETELMWLQVNNTAPTGFDVYADNGTINWGAIIEDTTQAFNFHTFDTGSSPSDYAITITTPDGSPAPTWITINESTGWLTIAPTDRFVAGTVQRGPRIHGRVHEYALVSFSHLLRDQRCAHRFNDIDNLY